MKHLLGFFLLFSYLNNLPVSANDPSDMHMTPDGLSASTFQTNPQVTPGLLGFAAAHSVMNYTVDPTMPFTFEEITIPYEGTGVYFLNGQMISMNGGFYEITFGVSSPSGGTIALYREYDPTFAYPPYYAGTFYIPPTGSDGMRTFSFITKIGTGQWAIVNAGTTPITVHGDGKASTAIISIKKIGPSH